MLKFCEGLNMAKLIEGQVYTIRPMQDKDIPQALDVDREAFPTQWPHPTYSSLKHELRNKLAYYFVASRTNEITRNEDDIQSVNRTFWERLRNVPTILAKGNLSNEVLPPPSRDYIAGIAGFWLMAGEAHIITIGVRDSCRQQGIGERLLISIIDMVIRLNADLITLEVRISNKQAQTLYSKYNFYQVGIRKGYYSDNSEDAAIMTTDPINSASFKTHFEQLRQSYELRYGRI
jgi:ribosomal-protein-alanine N-acetyltransferase